MVDAFFSIDFWRGAISTLIGTTAGFVFSLSLFYVTERIKNRNRQSQVLRSLLRELDLNLTYLRREHSNLNTMITRVGADDQQIYLRTRFYYIVRYFLQQAYQEGVLYRFLDNVWADKINDIFNRYGPNTDTYLNGLVESWERGEATKTDVTRDLVYARDLLATDIRDIEEFHAMIRGFERKSRNSPQLISRTWLL
jgi:hypothetical protein